MVDHNHREQKGQSTLQIIQCNIQKGSAKQATLLEKAFASGVDVICVQEPWIDLKARKTTKHPRYTMQSPLHSWTERPRVITYIKRGLMADQLFLNDAEHPDICASRIKWESAHFNIFNVYNACPGSQRTNESVNIITSMAPRGKEIFCGDFNLHHRVWDAECRQDDVNAEALVEWMATNSLCLMTDRTIPTRGNAVIDLALSTTALRDAVYASASVDATFDCGSDHEATLITLQRKTAQHNAPARQAGHFNMKKLDREKFAQVCRDVAKSIVVPPASTPLDGRRGAVTDLVTYIQDGLTKALSESSPCTSGKQSGYRWWTADCKAAAAEHRMHRRAWKTAPTPALKEAARQARNKAQRHLTKVVKKAKNDHFTEVIGNLNSPRDVFRATSWTQQDQHFSSPPLKKPSGELVTDTQGKMDFLFQTHAPETASRDVPGRFFVYDCPWGRWSPLSREEICQSIFKPANTTPGVDLIPNEALKLAWEFLGDALVSFFNLSLGWGIYPDALKMSRLCVIPKGGKRDKTNPRSYRLIALLPTLGKTLERAIAKRIAIEAIEMGIIPPRYTCAVPKRSSTDLLLDLMSNIEKVVVQDKKIATMVTFDVRGAFDAICPNRLVRRLSLQGWPTVLCRWIKEFLNRRQADMKMDDQISDITELRGALPQGSPLSPILFMIFMAPLYHMHSNMRGYADDGCLLLTGNSTEENARSAAQQLQQITTWCNDNALELDHAKTGLLHVTRKLKATNSDVSLDDGTIIRATAPKESMRWLGIHFDRKLTFTQHIKIVSSKADRVVGGMRLLAGCQKGAPAAALLNVIRAAVIPVLTYGFQVWWPPDTTQQRMKSGTARMDVVLRRAIKAALPLYRTTPSHLVTHAAGIPTTELILDDLVHAEAIRLAGLDARHILRLPIHETSRVDRIRKTLPKPLPQSEHLVTPKHDRNVQRVAAAHASKDEQCERHRQLWETANSDDVWIYTDGSRNAEGSCGSGWAIYQNKTCIAEGAESCGAEAEVFDAEAIGALRGVEEALRSTQVQTGCLWLCIDNKGIVENLTKQGGLIAPRCSSHQELWETRHILDSWPGRQVTIMWVPGHLDICGNEHADRLAKQGAQSSPRQESPTMTVAYAKRWRKAWLLDKFRNWWQSARRAGRDIEKHMEAPRPWKKLYRDLPRGCIAHVLAARSGHGDLADYHDWLQHADAQLDCARCGARKDRLHPWCCRKGIGRRPLSMRFVSKLLTTERGIVYLGKCLQTTRPMG